MGAGERRRREGEEEVGPGTGWFSGPKETDRTGSSSWEEVLHGQTEVHEDLIGSDAKNEHVSAIALVLVVLEALGVSGRNIKNSKGDQYFMPSSFVSKIVEGVRQTPRFPKCSWCFPPLAVAFHLWPLSCYNFFNKLFQMTHTFISRKTSVRQTTPEGERSRTTTTSVPLRHPRPPPSNTTTITTTTLTTLLPRRPRRLEFITTHSTQVGRRRTSTSCKVAVRPPLRLLPRPPRPATWAAATRVLSTLGLTVPATTTATRAAAAGQTKTWTKMGSRKGIGRGG